MDAEGDITSRVMAPAVTVGSAAAEPDGMSGADALSLGEVVARGATEALPQRAEPRRARVERAKLRQQAAEAEHSVASCLCSSFFCGWLFSWLLGCIVAAATCASYESETNNERTEITCTILNHWVISSPYRTKAGLP